MTTGATPVVMKRCFRCIPTSRGMTGRTDVIGVVFSRSTVVTIILIVRIVAVASEVRLCRVGKPYIDA